MDLGAVRKIIDTDTKNTREGVLLFTNKKAALANDSSVKFLRGSDGTRTRNFCRDRAVL